MDVLALAEKGRLTIQGLIGVLNRLQKKGYITKILGGGRGKPNQYLLYPELELPLETVVPDNPDGEETVNAVDSLHSPKQSTPYEETVNAVGYKQSTPYKETLNGVDSFSLEKQGDLEGPNRKGTVIRTVKGANAHFSSRMKTPKKKKRLRSATIDLDTVSFPDGFDTPELRTAILGWAEARKTKHGVPTLRACNLAIQNLEHFGLKVVIEQFNQSTIAGYAGVFPPKPSQANSNKKTNRGLII
jgi:hypothetical protein